MEIRIILDSVEPLVGRLRALSAPGQAHRHDSQEEIGFTGWLGLLRALYDVTGTAGAGTPAGR